MTRRTPLSAQDRAAHLSPPAPGLGETPGGRGTDAFGLVGSPCGDRPQGPAQTGAGAFQHGAGTSQHAERHQTPTIHGKIVRQVIGEAHGRVRGGGAGGGLANAAQILTGIEEFGLRRCRQQTVQLADGVDAAT